METLLNRVIRATYRLENISIILKDCKKKSKYAKAQIAFNFNHAKSVAHVVEVYQKLRNSQASFITKKKYGVF